MDTNKRRVLMNAFMKSQFSYCMLAWIFYGRTLNNKIGRLHEKALRLAHKNKTSLSFEDLPKNDETVNIHLKNYKY